MTQLGGEIAGYDCEREKFLGVYRSFDRPEAVERGACGNSEHFSDNGCGAIQSNLELAPGASAEVLVLLGIGQAAAGPADPREVRHGRGLRAGAGEAQGALARPARHDAGADARPGLRPHDERLGRLQRAHDLRVVALLLARLHRRPARRLRLPRHRAGLPRRHRHDAGGGARAAGPHALRPGRHRRRPARDPPVVARAGQDEADARRPTTAATTACGSSTPCPAYVAETGDVGFYREVVPFADKGRATVFGHLRRALEFNLARTGRHGLPCGLQRRLERLPQARLQGRVASSSPSRSASGCKTYAEIAAQLGQPKERRWALAELAKLDRKIAKVCWDGGWFIWAIGEDGTVFGTKRAKEGQIYLNTQCWAILSGAATPEQTDQRPRRGEEAPRLRLRRGALQPAVRQDAGARSCARCCSIPATRRTAASSATPRAGSCSPRSPAATATRPTPITARSCRRRRTTGRRSARSSPTSTARARTRPPRRNTAGRACPWLSGTASWAHYTATQFILGIRPEIDGLRIDPCIPKAWPGFTVKRVFRGKHAAHRGAESRPASRAASSRSPSTAAPVAGNLVPTAGLKDGAKIVAVLG